MNKLFELNFFYKGIKELTQELDKQIQNNNKVSVFTPNVDHIINNENNELAKNIYSKSEYIIADGWPLVAVAKLKKMEISRITGVDLMDELLKLADKNKYNVFFLGATEDTLVKLSNNVKIKFPNIKQISYHHGFFDNDEEVINKINESGNNILFVGMGNPKQEIWIRNNFDKLNSNIMLGIGGALKIFSEEVERAPQWIQKIGMEWFYRFLKEPNRLFSRYFIKYPKFIKILIKELKI